MSHDSSPSHGMPPLATGGARPKSRGPAALSPGSPVRLIRQLSAGRQQQQQQQQQQAERQEAAAGRKAPAKAEATSSTRGGAAVEVRQQSNLGSSRPKSKGNNIHAASRGNAAVEQAAPHGHGSPTPTTSQNNGPSSPEEGIDQCMAALVAFFNADSCSAGGSNRNAIKTEALLIAHRLNTCFMAARSFPHATALAERAAFGRPAAADPSPTAQLSASSAAAAPSTSSEAAAAAAAAGGCLMQTLTEILHNAEPHAILALNCLSFLAASPRVMRELLVSAGLVPLLLGQLRHGQALEPLLISSSLTLLVTLVQADAQQAPRQLVPRHVASLAAVTSSFIVQAQQPRCQDLALQLLEELASTRAGSQLICSHKGLGLAMDQAAAIAGEGPRDDTQTARFRKRLSAVRKLAALLAPQEAKQATV